MPVDVEAAEQYILANSRLLDRHRIAVLLHDAPIGPVLTALRAYRNPDGGFGHALEPDVRSPESQPTSSLHALSVLAKVEALDDPMVEDAASWISTIAENDGGVPLVLDTAAAHPHAPFLTPGGGSSFLTFGFVSAFLQADVNSQWLQSATAWCWSRLENLERLHAYGVKFALEFLDAVEDETRANRMIEHLRQHLDVDGSIGVQGGTEDEKLTPLTLSERPQDRSRRIFTDDQVENDLDLLESGQQEDGGWTFDWLGWSEGQALEWRGIMTVRALTILRSHGRLT